MGAAMAQPRLHAIIRGRVQMVGFRAFVQRRALELGLAGYARNTPEGMVEVVAEGPRERLEPLLADLHRGPPAARVDGVDARWEQGDGTFRSFRIGC
jgi:acylphosphatase